MFVKNEFSKKVATVLILTIFQSIIGSFVVFFVLCNCFGPQKQLTLTKKRVAVESSDQANQSDGILNM
jgi:capsular polysaccharide biosynthesis protein